MNPLVSPHWLASHLGDPVIAVLDATLPPVGVTPVVDTHARYVRQHIPGAVFFDIEAFSDSSSGLPHTLPGETAFAAGMSALGLRDDRTFVVYEQEGVFSAARCWWMLRTFGVANVTILDGGLRAWLQAGLPVESGQAVLEPAVFGAFLRGEHVASLADVRAAIEGHQQILDARSTGRFSGSAPEPRPGISSGHMPGAASIPYLELNKGGRMKSAEQLRDLFATKQVDLERPLTTTCGSGVTAAVIALALEIVGAPSVRLYDGSWAEYAQQPDVKIVRDQALR